MSVQMRPVTSSNVVAVGYDPATRYLFVQFKSGLYRYDEVPAPMYHGLMAAPSVGKYLNAEIKPRYTYVPLPRLIEPLSASVSETVRAWESGVTRVGQQDG